MKKTKNKLSSLITKQLKQITLPIYIYIKKKTQRGAFFIKIKATYLVTIPNSLQKNH